jgi:signal transduction histidine kinase
MHAALPSSAPLGLLVRRWPERRRVLALGAAGLLAGVLVAVVAVDDAARGPAFLAVVPIVLVALEFGQRAGLAVSALAFAAILAIAAERHPSLDAIGIATHGTALLASAVVAGRFSDRMRAVHARQERLLRSGLRLSEAEGRERLAAVAAGEATATPGVSGAVVRLDGVPGARAGRLDGARTSLPMTAHGLRVGTLETVHTTAPATEDRAALELLARQAAMVAENLRLLEIDAERAALEARLREVRRELLDSRSGTGLLLRAQEDGKRRMAVKLHEDLAQVLSAVLLGMRMLERGGTAEAAAVAKDLHDQVAHVLADVRDVARELRPVVLDQLGLASALEALARTAHDRGGQVDLRVARVPAGLSDDIETLVYRLVEDVLELGSRAEVTLDALGDGVELLLRLEAVPQALLLALRARAGSAGGTVTVGDAAGGARAPVRVTLPLGG